MVRGKSKPGSKAVKGKGKARPRDPNPVVSSHHTSNDNEITSAATSEYSSECGHCLETNIISMPFLSSFIRERRVKLPPTSQMYGIQEDMMTIPIRVSRSQTDPGDYSHVLHTTR